ncbi:MAG: PKD domain-containing protein [Bacteroidota bacterium]
MFKPNHPWKTIFTGICIIITACSLQATHFMGVDVSYECIGTTGCTYRMTHKTYYDCSGGATAIPPRVAPRPSISIAGTSGGCTGPRIIGNWVLVSYTEVTPICPFIPTTCTNRSSPVNGVLEAVYYADYDFCNLNCSYYTINWGDCCRSGQITTGAANLSVGISSRINLAVNPCNTSPSFGTEPIFYICNSRQTVLSQRAFDPDGDSLVYSFTPCKSMTGGLVPYTRGSTPQNPLAPDWTVTLDSLTGDITFTPDSISYLKVAVMCITVDEYRNGQNIGSVTRDMQIAVINCGANTNIAPTIDSVTQVLGGTQIGPDTFGICYGDTFSMFVTASDSNALDSLVASSPSLTNLFPSASISQTGKNPVIIRIDLVPTTVGTFNFNLKVEDTFCPFNTEDNKQFTFEISPCLSSSITNARCGIPNGAIDLTVIGVSPPYAVLWSTGDTTEDLSGILPGFYSVTITDSAGNTLSESFVVSGININLNPTVTTLSCNQPMTGISVAPTGGILPFTYSWTTGDTTSTVTVPGQGRVTVFVLDSTGCPAQQSFVVNPPDSCFNLIRGTLYHDVNGNCIKDAGEIPVSFAMVDLTPGGAVMTDVNGDYVIRADSGTFTLDVWPRSFTTINCPVSGNHVLNFSGLSSDTSGLDFALDIDSIQDLAVTLRSTIARPGRALRYYLGYRNNGYRVMNGSVELEHDSLVSFIGATPGQNSYSAANRQLTWNFTNLLPAEFRQITIDVVVDSTVQVGDTLVTDASVLPVAGDTTPGNNVIQFVDTVRTSFDPNTKQVFPKGIGMRGFIEPTENEMDYTVRFQNTGNDTAFFVVIRDTLDSDLDVSSIQIEGYSHDFSLNIEDDEVLVFTFANINLPDSSTDFTGSQGFVAYSINHDGTLPVGTEINNRAAIYFDFNAPIITNTVTNTVFTYPEVSLTGPDSLCQGQFLVAAITQAGMPPYLFGWSDGSQDPNNQLGISQLAPITSGTYAVTVTDAFGFTTTDQFDIILSDTPDASFTLGGSGLTQVFIMANNLNTYIFWDLGDGTTVTDQKNVTHRYSQSGTYTVTAIATNTCGSDTFSQTIRVIASGLDPAGLSASVSLRPNPFSESTMLEFANPNRQPYELRILDLSGKAVQHYPAQTGNRFEILRGELASGMYFYQLAGERQAVGKLWVE